MFVYMLASKKHGTIYTGTARELLGRVWKHKNKVVPGFTARYGVDRLVWFEQHATALEAITREKQLKKWRRDWKIRLIEESNPNWDDLFPTLSP
jgi:putative endonuclease